MTVPIDWRIEHIPFESGHEFDSRSGRGEYLLRVLVYLCLWVLHGISDTGEIQAGSYECDSVIYMPIMSFSCMLKKFVFKRHNHLYYATFIIVTVLTKSITVALPTIHGTYHVMGTF